MALTRKLLKALSISDEAIDQIIEAHSETVEGLKADLSKYKTDAEKLTSVQKELDDLKQLGDGGYKEKYETERKAFEKFKTDVEKKEARSAKESAYTELLKSAGVNEKRIASVLKLTDIDSLTMTEGKLDNADKLTEAIKSEWSDFIVQQQQSGAKTPNPPSNQHQAHYSMDDIKKMSTAEINKNWDAIKASLNNKGE